MSGGNHEAQSTRLTEGLPTRLPPELPQTQVCTPAGRPPADTTGIAIYTEVNDFYKPLRDFLHPLYAFLRLFTPLYKSPFAKQQHKSAIILIWFWRYHAQDQIIEA